MFWSIYKRSYFLYRSLFALLQTKSSMLLKSTNRNFSGECLCLVKKTRRKKLSRLTGGRRRTIRELMMLDRHRH